MRFTTKLVLGTVLSAAFLAPAMAAGNYPDHTVRVVVPFPPGGSTDIIGRITAEYLSKALNQTFIVENKSGAGGNIGIENVSRAKPDGYTLVIGAPQTLIINRMLYKDFKNTPTEDLVPISVVATIPNVMTVNKDVPADSVQAFIDYAKTRPGELNYSSPSLGSTAQLSSEILKFMAGIDVKHIPYKGSAPAITALIGGEVDMMIDNLPSSLSFIRAGNLRALAVTSAERSPSLPDVPTMEEAGLKGFVTQGWFGVLAPKGTPQAVVDTLNKTINDMLESPEIIEKLDALGASPKKGDPASVVKFIESETALWEQAIDHAGIQPQ